MSDDPLQPQNAENDRVDLFGHAEASDPDAAGPLSVKGIRAIPQRTVTLGDFRILGKTGTGSMGAVYLAYQLSHGRQVALKVLGKDLAHRPGFVERFYREAALLEKLSHPNIVHGYGVGEEHGFYYFAMEYIDGQDMSRLLTAFGGKLVLGDALHIALRCAAALGHAHSHKVIHRDVTPENILITRKGHVKLTDLGLAKPIDDGLDLTKSHTGMGTPRYMAPEQARDAKSVGPGSDIYALGSVLYHFLTGSPPYPDGHILDQIEAKERGVFIPASQKNRSVPRRCDRVLARMLAPTPAGRYATCDSLVKDLDGLGLVSKTLSFNLSQVEGEATAVMPAAPPRRPLEVLLVFDDLSYIPLLQRALHASNVPSNLTVAEDGNEAQALLQRVGKAPEMPQPDLIVLGLSQPTPSSMRVLATIEAHRALQGTALCALSTAPEAADLLRDSSLEQSLWITGFDDLGPLEEIIRKVYRSGKVTERSVSL